MTKKNLKLTSEQVKHIAQLANLTLTPSEIKKFQKQLSETLDYVSQLSKVDTKNIKPTSHVTGLENVFREDEVLSSLSQEEILSGAKNKVNGFFKTKAILEV